MAEASGLGVVFARLVTMPVSHEETVAADRIAANPTFHHRRPSAIVVLTCRRRAYTRTARWSTYLSDAHRGVPANRGGSSTACDVEVDGCFYKRLQGPLVDFVALVEIDRTPHLAIETRVEEA